MADIQEMIDSSRQKVRDYLAEVDPDFQEYDSGMFTVQEGSAVIGISFRPWHDDDVAVEFTSQLVNGATINEESMRWLLEKNAALHFGSFGLLFDGSIIYSHTIPAACLDQSTFDGTLRTVATIADYYDDEIVEVAGGVLASTSPGAEETEIEESL
ncbi:MAG: YbjN domain-containing protein [Ignavibacteriae bacterium]|nr:YbjN domain-containing protein [Ignavibacteriota bacterium]MCB9217134.1 YbjN domain-containing protein [Ignavibacteria bacterium]